MMNPEMMKIAMEQMVCARFKLSADSAGLTNSVTSVSLFAVEDDA